MPRKSSPRKKPRIIKGADSRAREVFSVRFSTEEVKQLRIEAEARGSTLAALVRDVVMGSMNQVATVMISGASTASGAMARVYGDLARPIHHVSSDAA
jgi:hypothetical protein